MMVFVSPFHPVQDFFNYTYGSSTSSLYSHVGMYTCTIKIVTGSACNLKSNVSVITHSLLKNTTHCAFVHHYYYPSFSTFTCRVTHHIITTSCSTLSFPPHFIDTQSKHCGLLHLLQVLQFSCFILYSKFQSCSCCCFCLCV